MPWHARLQLDYRLEAGRTVARFQHDGPLRILQSLYPEGDTVCHNVLVHPPGGLVGGDTLDLAITVAPSSHGLLSTPGATRFYRSSGEPATQQVSLQLQAGARLEWLPLETICHSGCQARNTLDFELAEGAQLIAWDVTALGLPGAQQAFERGSLAQRMHWPGRWLEQARIGAEDQRLLNSPLGLAGQRCMATLVAASGTPFGRTGRERLLEALRDVMAHPAAPAQAQVLHAGATSPGEGVIVVRVLAPVVEPAMGLLRQLWACLRREWWQMSDRPPRIWSV